MDFKQFDVRDASDDGAFCHLVHPQTREPLMDGREPVGFMVRGNASRAAQTALAKARSAVKKKVETANDLHESEIRVASALIIEARGIDIEGEPVGNDKGRIRQVLDMTFPEIRAKTEDERGEGEEGGVELLNLPFANQVLQFASRQDNFLGE